MTSAMFAPPDEITWWHARTLEAAEAGRIRYDVHRYPIHQVDNNTVQMLWMGLLVDHLDGPVITEIGQTLLDAYRAARPAPAPLPALSAPQAESHLPSGPLDAYEQPDLFTAEETP